MSSCSEECHSHFAFVCVCDVFVHVLFCVSACWCGWCVCVSEADPGPFSILQQCRKVGGRVRVTIRHCAGVRGVCEGTLLVYDKHLNLALRDVTEWCNPLRTVGNGGITESKRARRRREKREAEVERSGVERGQQDGFGVGCTRVDTERAEGNTGSGHDSSGPGQGGNTTAGPGTADGGEGNSSPGQGDNSGLEQGISERKSVPEQQKWEVCRTVKQLFVRGDNIIHIIPLKGIGLTTTDTLADH